MELSFGPHGPCQRGGFCELIEEMGANGLCSSSTAVMEAHIGTSRRCTREAVRRAAQVAKEANVKPARLYLRSTSRGLRKAVDIYMPLFKKDPSPACSEGEQEGNAESQPQVHQPPSVPPQAEELSYTGTFPHFHRLGMWKLMNEYVNGASSRAKIPSLDASSGSANSHKHIPKKHLTGGRILENHRWNQKF